MKMEDRQASRIHYNMALIGGFLGAYGVVSRGNFPSAQTGNMISILTMAIGRKPLDFLIHVGALVVYVAAIVLCTWLPKHAKIRLPQLSLAVSSIAAVLMTMIPMNADPILSLYPLFFATAFQWCSFERAKGYSCSTIFSTNNLKQTVTSAAAWFMTKKEDPDRLNKADRALFYGGTLLCFYGGAAAGYKAWGIFGMSSILLTLIPLFICGVLIGKQKHRS